MQRPVGGSDLAPIAAPTDDSDLEAFRSSGALKPAPAKTPKADKADALNVRKTTPETERESAARQGTKTTAPATQADDEDVETDSETDEDDEAQESAYNAALKTLELDELTPEDVHGWSKKRVIAFAEKRAAVHAALDKKLSQANSQRGETTRNGAAQGKAPQGHTPLSGLQERHVKEIAALWDDESAQAIVKVIGETASAYSPVIEELKTSLETGAAERAELRKEVDGLREELRLDRMYRRAVAEDSSIAEGDTWDRVVAQMTAQQRTGQYKRTPKGDARLLSDSLAIVQRDKSKTLQTDRARELGQVGSLHRGPGKTGDSDLDAFRDATNRP